MLTADGHTAVAHCSLFTVHCLLLTAYCLLLTLSGRHMLGPAERPLWPDVEALSWHGRQVFRRR
jgi:hypothetical protein